MPEAPDILLAEDDAEDAELAAGVLAQAGLDARIVRVKDGQEVLDYVRAQGSFAGRAGSPAPKVILLDLKMPRVTGQEALRSLKADPATRCIPVVILTSSRAERDIVESCELGANSYVVKPVDFDEYSALLTSVARYWIQLNVCKACLAR